MTDRKLRLSWMLLLPLVVAACDEPRAETAADWDGTGVGWTTELVSRIPEVSREAQLEGLAPIQRVRTAEDDGFDRFVVEIQGRGMPNYHVQYPGTPLRDCESGELVDLAGDAMLHVRLEPAIAHDENDRPLFEDAPSETGLTTLLQQQLICDEEGSVEWALGLDSRTEYRVMQLTELNRVVLDVRH